LEARQRRIAQRFQFFKASADQHFYALASGGNSGEASHNVLPLSTIYETLSKNSGG
jgi:hypothetical protein